MARTTLWFVVLLLVPLARATAQAPEMFSEESLQAVAASVIADGDLSPPRMKSDQPYWIMVAWLTAATIYDVESTFFRLERCECIEVNPIVKPFVDRGRLATYAYSGVVNGLIMVVAKRMYNHAHPWWRFFPVAVSAVHGIAGTWNLYLAAHEQE